MEHFRILVIDDNEHLLNATKRALRGHTVIECLGGKLAIQLLDCDHHWDIILCDMSMPEVDGLGVYEFIRENIPDLLPRLCFATGGGTTPKTIDFLENCPNLVLRKPGYLDDIQARISEIVATLRS